MYAIVIEFIGLFFTGLLAGAEFIVRYGIRGPLATLEPRPHIQLRQALIYQLRLLVPALLLPALGLGTAVTLLGGAGPVFTFRLAGALSLLLFLLATVFGTVPINKGALAWSPDAPPTNWEVLVARWEGLNTVRTLTALSGFVCFLMAITLQLPVGA